MKIGIVGCGYIGKTLVGELVAAGHDVKVANSRGPETIATEVAALGGQAVAIAEAVSDIEAVILSVPFGVVPSLAATLADLPDDTAVIDTSNYYPHRDGNIGAIEDGQVESLWVVEQLGRPVAKAWNAIGSDSLARLGQPAGAAGRLAIPFAADRDADRTVAVALIGDTGFDPFDAGSLAESWRQQPGTPCYCTDLRTEEMAAALESAEPGRGPKRRDLAIAAIQERLQDSTTNPSAEYLVRLNRALYM